MSSDDVMMFVGFIFFTVFFASQILVIPTLGTRQTNRKKLKQRLEGVFNAHPETEMSIIKEKYLKRLTPLERNLEYLPGMQRLKTFLEQSGDQQLAYRFALFCLSLSAGSAFIVWKYYHHPLSSLIAFVLVLFIPFFFLNKKRTKRFDKFEEQLPHALQMMARALRAGHPFSESMKIVSTEMSEPISVEFGMTYDEINYGRDIEVAFALMIQRVPSLSLIAMSTAIIIQRQTGGNLAEVLLKISSVLSGRFKLQRRIKSLSADGVFSAWAMLLMPLVLFLGLNWSSPDYFKPVYESSEKMLFFYVFMGLELSAAIWIRIIITIDA